MDRPYNEEAHSDYQAYLGEKFGYGNNPEANTRRHWIDMPAALGPDLFRKVQEWVRSRPFDDRPGAWIDSSSHPRALWSIGEPVGMAIGQHLEPIVSAALGMQAHISYCGVTEHSHGVPCVRHRDVNRGSKFLLSWPIDLDIEKGTWPLHIERVDDGVDAEDNTDPEKALLFSGHDVWHWRDPYPGQRGRLLFMRYSVCKEIRMFSGLEVAQLATEGWRELCTGISRPPDGVIKPMCNFLSEDASRDHYVIPEVFTPAEVESILDQMRSHPEVHQPTTRKGTRWVQHTLGELDFDFAWWKSRECARAAAPALISECPYLWDYVSKADFTLSEYLEGDSHVWHSDFLEAEEAERLGRSVNWSQRAVTTVILLHRSDIGGRLEFQDLDIDDTETKPGDAIVFPSRAVHRVSPVCSGRRVALSRTYGWMPQ